MQTADLGPSSSEPHHLIFDNRTAKKFSASCICPFSFQRIDFRFQLIVRVIAESSLAQITAWRVIRMSLSDEKELSNEARSRPTRLEDAYHSSRSWEVRYRDSEGMASECTRCIVNCQLLKPIPPWVSAPRCRWRNGYGAESGSQVCPEAVVVPSIVSPSFTSRAPRYSANVAPIVPLFGV